MEIETSKLIGPALDWAVAKGENNLWLDYENALNNDTPIPPRPSEYLRDHSFDKDEFQPSANWSQGGPIIDREGISIRRVSGDWFAMSEHYCGSGQTVRWSEYAWSMEKLNTQLHIRFDGPTPLIAAMRCYVASKLGGVVDVPDVYAHLSRD